MATDSMKLLTDDDLTTFRLINQEQIDASPTLKFVVEQAEEAVRLQRKLQQANATNEMLLQSLGERNFKLRQRNFKLRQALEAAVSELMRFIPHDPRLIDWSLLATGLERPSPNKVNIFHRSVLQDWVHELPFMQQSVLIAAVRGPDGIKKDHPVKVLCRYLRRSFMLSAFDGTTKWSPYEPGGGSFTGPLKLDGLGPDEGHLDKFVGIYLRHVDELPHHFQLHLMHAAEILGYKHPDGDVRGFWNTFYQSVVKDAHLRPESCEAMNERLGDREESWRANEVVIAEGSGITSSDRG